MKVAALAAVVGLAAAAAWSSEIDVPGVVRLSRLADLDGDGVAEVLVVAAQEGYDPNGVDVASRKDTLHAFRVEEGRLVPLPARPLAGLVSGFSVLDVTGDRTREVVLVTGHGLVIEGDGGDGVRDAGAAFLHEDRSDLDLDLATDLDGDGTLDLALPTVAGMRFRLWADGVPLPDRRGMDLPVKAISVGSEAPTPLARLGADGAPPRASFLRFLPRIGDLDGDGRPDAVLPLSGRLARFEGLLIHFGSAEGSPFEAAGRPIELELRPGEVLSGADALAFGDLDGDGIQELGILTFDLEDFGFTQTRRLRVFRFREGYVPDPAPLLDVETSANLWEPSRVTMSDQDGDGRGDLLVTHIGGLRKAAFTAEHYVRGEDGSFRKREDTRKLSKDDAIDRASLLPPTDLDGDGRADFVVVGKKVVYVLAGVMDGKSVFREPPLASIRPAGAAKVLHVMLDERAEGARALYVVYRTTAGKARILRQAFGKAR